RNVRRNRTPNVTSLKPRASHVRPTVRRRNSPRRRRRSRRRRMPSRPPKKTRQASCARRMSPRGAHAKAPTPSPPHACGAEPHTPSSAEWKKPDQKGSRNPTVSRTHQDEWKQKPYSFLDNESDTGQKPKENCTIVGCARAARGLKVAHAPAKCRLCCCSPDAPEDHRDHRETRLSAHTRGAPRL